MFALLLSMFFVWLRKSTESELYSNGYITYCPCMGRFGNQADHFLGALAFAKSLNRTLILPPWVEYRKGEVRSIQVPFNFYFSLEAVKKYHNVILMEDFMRNIASKLWPEHKRVSFCYMERKSMHTKKNKPDCHAKEGNPFGSFWDTYNISFNSSEFYGPLHFDTYHNDMPVKWNKRYPHNKWPVIAFTGAPASFPVQSENYILQKYLKWNNKMRKAALKFIQNNLPKGAFIGLHLRNGVDWVKACNHIRYSKQLFASPQCLGYNNERGDLYPQLCMPDEEMIIRQIERLVKKVKKVYPHNQIRSIFVASDANHMIDILNVHLKTMNITAYRLAFDDPHLDLVILGLSNHFIGNCISSYTAFVKRERDISGFPSHFWAYPKQKDRNEYSEVHAEL